MSFLFSNIQPSVSSSGTSLPSEEVKRQKFLMTSVPAGLVNQDGFPMSKKKQKSRSKIVSIAYNSVASRPTAFKLNKITHYPVNMTYSVSSVFTTSTVATVLLGYSFALSSFADYTAYVALFDQYRIDMLEIYITPQSSQSTVISNTGELVTAIDLDDASTPSSYNSVAAHQSSLMTSNTEGHYHKWIPHMAIAVYSGAFTSFANAPAGWLDCGSPNVQHYGLKFASTTTSVAMVLDMVVRARISFRQAGL